MPHRDDFDDDLLDPSEDAYDYKPVSSNEGSGGKAVKLLVAVTVIAGLAGGAWYVVGSSDQTQDKVPVVRAEPTPMKEKPSDPGGMEIPNRDKTVYDRLSGENSEPKLERLLPRPEQPLEKPAMGTVTQSLPPLPVEEQTPQTNTESEKTAEAEVTPAVTVEETKEELPPVPPAAIAEEITEPAPAPIEDPNAPRALVKRSDQPAAVVKKDKDDLSAKIAEALNEKVEETPSPVQVTKKAPPPAPIKPKPSAENPSSGYVMQLLSSKSESGVKTTWEKIKSSNSDIVKGLSANIVKADLGDKGIYYRLRLGPVATGDEAKNICSKFKKRDVGCFIVRVQ
ncbi:MAG: SPOR domain-containing protein [Methylocystaceae bacterium]|nr:SPOR domain-containing protein [Methylocystaceae bacterium]